MKRHTRGLGRVLSTVPLLLLCASLAPVTAASAGGETAGEAGPATERATRDDSVPHAARIAEATDTTGERRHIRPEQRGLRRSHRRVDQPERLLFGADVAREFAGAEHCYLRFDEIVDHMQRRYLRTQGILLTSYAGDNTYVAAVTPDGREFLEASPEILVAGEIPVEDKVEQDLLDGRIPEWAEDERGRVLVHVRFHVSVAFEEALRALKAHAASILRRDAWAGFHMLDAAVEPTAVRDLARRDVVSSISMKAPDFVPFNADAAAITGTDLLWNPPYDLDGSGYTVGIWDTGAVHPHVEFGDRLTPMEWDDPVDVAGMGFPEQQVVMVVEGHTPTDTYSITQNADATVIDATTSQPCYPGSGPTRDHTWMRVFDLNVEHGVDDLFCVDSVRYAVESVSGNPEVTFKVHCTPPNTADNDVGTIYWDDLSTQYTVTIEHPDAQNAFFDQPLDGCCLPVPVGGEGWDDLAIEITVEDCAETGNCDHFFIGVNDEGQTKPSYYAATDCTIFPVDPGAYASHATHAAGTIGASGTLPWPESQQSHGMAHQVDLLNWDFYGFNAEYLDAISAGNVVVSSNGWGYDIGWYWFEGCTKADGCLPEIPPGWYYIPNTQDFGAYTLESWWVDYTAVVAESSGVPFPVVFAAGNERGDGPPGGYDGTYYYNPDEARTYYDNINPLAGAKNAITVGAVEDDGGMTAYSSWGPCDDGRIKPDLVAPGHGLLSPVGAADADYQIMTGSSMAAAVVAGSTVLLIEQYEDTFGIPPTNGELKALLINSTHDLGNPGPDYVYGYGLLDAKQAVDTILSAGDLSTIDTGQLGQAQTDIYGVVVPPGTPELKVTMAWMDWPGNDVSPVPAIVNNLDLRLISPTGRSHYPFRLSAADPVADATTGINLRDTVEQVVVEDPEVGSWIVEIKGSSVPQGPQRYGLVSRNGVAAPSVYDILPPPVLYNFPYPYREARLSVKYTDPTGAGIDPASVTMRVNWFDVTGEAVITSEGAYYDPWYPLSELDEHWFEVNVASFNGLETNSLNFFNYVDAGEVAGLTVSPGTAGSVDLAWGDPAYDSSKLSLLEYRVYRSNDMQQELDWIGTTTSHGFTDTTVPGSDLVTYEVHALFAAGSQDRILSIRETPHRTRQPFIAYPRDKDLEALPAGDFAVRVHGMAEPGSAVTVYVDGAEAGTTTTLENGSFVHVHDFGGPGQHTVSVQAKAAGKGISVPSAEVDLELLP